MTKFTHQFYLSYHKVPLMNYFTDICIDSLIQLIIFFLIYSHVMPVILYSAKRSEGNIIDAYDNLNIPMKHVHVFYAIFFSKVKSPFLSNSEDLCALCPVESVSAGQKFRTLFSWIICDPWPLRVGVNFEHGLPKFTSLLKGGCKKFYGWTDCPCETRNRFNGIPMV